MVSVQNLDLAKGAISRISDLLDPFVVLPSAPEEEESSTDLLVFICLPPQHHLLLRFHVHHDGIRVQIATDTAAKTAAIPLAHDFLRHLAASVSG